MSCLHFACPCGTYVADSLDPLLHAGRIAAHRAACPTDRRAGATPSQQAPAPALPDTVSGRARPYVRSVAELEDDGLRALVEQATARTAAHPARVHARPVGRLLPTDAELSGRAS